MFVYVIRRNNKTSYNIIFLAVNNESDQYSSPKIDKNGGKDPENRYSPMKSPKKCNGFQYRWASTSFKIRIRYIFRSDTNFIIVLCNKRIVITTVIKVAWLGFPHQSGLVHLIQICAIKLIWKSSFRTDY